jgi:PIN domain
VGEAKHELSRRLGILEAQGRLIAEQLIALKQGVDDLVETRAIEIVPRDTYASLEQLATERVPRDQRDWPAVALAMVLKCRHLDRRQRLPGLRMPNVDRRDAAAPSCGGEARSRGSQGRRAAAPRSTSYGSGRSSLMLKAGPTDTPRTWLSGRSSWSGISACIPPPLWAYRRA